MKQKQCVLCESIELRNDTWIAMWEPFPVGIGHMKIIPFRHDAVYSKLTEKEQRDYWDIVQKVIAYLDTCLGKHKPDGYNIGVNIGKAAGQTIDHLHIHVIPRYKGDVKDPRGGVRNIKKAIVEW